MITKYLHIKTFVGFLFILLAAACSNEDEAVIMPSSKGSVKQLQVTTMENATTRTEGDDKLNENLFVTLDYYFFANAADDDANNKLLLHKSETGLTDKSEHTYDGKFSDEELAAVFGEDHADGDKCYVYVVANLTVDQFDEDTQADIENKDIYLGELMRKEFQTVDISKNGKQESFVMYGGDNVTLSVTTEQGKTVKSLYGQVKVKRDAAKVVLTVTEVKDLLRFDADGNQIADDDTETEAVTFWKSDPNNMYVMFYNGVNKSTIHSQINQGYHYTPRKPDGIDNECYFTLDNTDSESSNPWRKLDQGTGYVNRTHQYPFYTYLSDWSESGVKERASYMILVVPWQQVDAAGDPVTPSFENTYYQIETTPVNIDAYYENYFYQISINVGVLGSFVKPEPVEVSAEYMIVPWGEVEVPGTLREGRYLILETKAYTVSNQPSASIPYISSHKITQAYVTNVEWLALNTFVSRNITNTTNTDGTLTVSTYVNNETFSVTTNDNKLTLNHAISSSQYTRYNVTVKIVNDAGLMEEAVFTIYPAIYADIKDGNNAFINGRFAHVYNPPSLNNVGWVHEHNEVNYYSSRSPRNGSQVWYISTGTGNNGSTNSYGSLSTTITAADDNVSNSALTRITVTSFNSTDEHFKIGDVTYSYKLSDPRVSSNLTLAPYLQTRQSNSQTASTANWDTSSIKVGTSSIDAIAPDLLVCSGWGRTKGENAQSFQTFQRRCATYQEAGYPAGRWRLPTEAELAFIYGLQEKGVIPVLFRNDGTPYWASSGRAIINYNTTTQTATFTSNTNYNGGNNAGVRCVYDVWYWGDKPQDPTNLYYAMPTKQNNN